MYCEEMPYYNRVQKCFRKTIFLPPPESILQLLKKPSYATLIGGGSGCFTSYCKIDRFMRFPKIFEHDCLNLKKKMKSRFL